MWWTCDLRLWTFASTHPSSSLHCVMLCDSVASPDFLLCSLYKHIILWDLAIDAVSHDRWRSRNHDTSLLNTSSASLWQVKMHQHSVILSTVYAPQTSVVIRGIKHTLLSEEMKTFWFCIVQVVFFFFNVVVPSLLSHTRDRYNFQNSTQLLCTFCKLLCEDL